VLLATDDSYTMDCQEVKHTSIQQLKEAARDRVRWSWSTGWDGAMWSESTIGRLHPDGTR